VSRYVEHYMREVIQASVKSNGTEPECLAPEVDAYTLWAHLPASWIRAIGRDPGWPAPKAMQRWVCDFPLHSQAILLQSLSHSEYEVWVENALEAAEALRDWRIMNLHLSTLGQLSVQAGDNQAALGYFKRQADVARESNAPAAEAEALMNAGVTHGALGQISQAEQDWQRALDLFERLDDCKADRVRVWLRELRSRINKRT
jgi:tetratricopeptide (TPR) repeat protein